MIDWRSRRRLGLGLMALATVAMMLDAGPASAAPEGRILDAGATGAVPDRYIVVVRDGVRDARALANGYGGTVSREYTSALHGVAVTMSGARARRLAADPAVAYVQQDRRVTATEVQANPPSWGLDRIDQQMPVGDRKYTYPTRAANVTAYVIDTGIRITHQTFGGRAAHGWDFVDNDAVADDCNGHGTHVAGTLGGDLYGVAKGVQLVAVRVLDCAGAGYLSAVIDGVDWVTAHATRPAVVNMSIGGPASSAVDSAVRASIASGITYAVAAGNENANACAGSPARIPDVITVGATDPGDRRASFSNHGNCVDIFAPGVNIRSSYRAGDTTTATMSGTSMATPHVAGAAALVLAASPTATPATVAATLVAKALANRVAGAGTGSPNRLLYTGGLAAPKSEPPAAVRSCWRRGSAGQLSVRMSRPPTARSRWSTVPARRSRTPGSRCTSSTPTGVTWPSTWSRRTGR